MSEITPEPAAEAVEPEAPESPAEEWSGVSQEDWQATQSTLAEQREAIEYFASLMQPVLPQQQEQGPQPVAIDPLDDGFQQQLDQYIEQKLAPYQQFVQAQQSQEGEQRSKDVLTDLATRDGEFDIDRAYEVALARFREAAAVQPAQATWDLLEKTLTQAAEDQRSYDKKVADAAVERYKNELAGLSGAPRDLAAAGTNGSQQFTIPQGGSLIDVAYRHGSGR